MADAGHDISAVVCPDDYIDQALAADGRVRRFAACFERTADLRATRAVIQAARAVRPDYLVGSFAREYWPTALVGRALGIPVVLFRHLDEHFSPQTARLLPRLVHRVVAPSEFLRQRIIDRGVVPARTAVLFNSIDSSVFHPDALARVRTREQLGFVNGDVIVGFVGRLESKKGVHMLVLALDAAMARCPQLRALWIGSGKEGAKVETAITKSRHHARHVRLPWSVDLPAYYAAMDMLAFPSIGSEAFGRVAVEAQACGVPVLASRTGGVPETLLAGQTGVLLPPGDVTAWADALVAIAGDAGARARMGAAGRRFVCEAFDGHRIARDFERLLRGETQTPLVTR